MPGAIALTFTSPWAAMAANVIMTPMTVPNKPRNGPPEIAIVRSTIRLIELLGSPCTRRAVEARADRLDRSRGQQMRLGRAFESKPVPDFCGANFVNAIDGGEPHDLRLAIVDPAA